MTKAIDLSRSVWVPWMRRALDLASLADGYTSPNPIVGAVIIDDLGKLVGEGFHSRAGDSHAEVRAINQAKCHARGGTLVVTLEPCCHQGLTPPCTDAVIEAGIKRVVVALVDPDPRVCGAGVRRLRDAGLEVITGILEQEALHQNRSFVHRVNTGRPWGILKLAVSIDGRTALPNGQSKWISGIDSRDWVHIQRARCDAVIVGGGTLRQDDPLLTSRGKRDPEPLRVVLTKSLDLPQEAKLWDLEEASTLIASSKEQLNSSRKSIPDGPEMVALPECEPRDLLQELASRGCNRILWECGPRLAASALRQGCVQELVAIVAPKLLGGVDAMTAMSELGFDSMEEVVELINCSFRQLGRDFLLKAVLPKNLQF